MIQVRCSACNRILRAEEQYRGKTARCSYCGANIEIIPFENPTPPIAPVPNHGHSGQDAPPPGPNVSADTSPLPSPEEVTSVFQSAGEGDWETVKKMVEAKPELARCSAGSWTLLHSAALYGNEDVANLLIRNGTDINAKTNQRKIEIWQKKLDGDEMPVDIPLENMRLSLHEIGREILVLWLPDSDTSRQSGAAGSECSALHIAAMCGRTSFVEFLIRNGANIAATDNDGLSALHYAARNKCEPLVNILLSAGLDVNVPDNSGCTPLYHAVVEDQKEIVEMLISKGADINRPNSINGNTPLHVSMLCRNTAMVRLLIKRGVNVNVQNDPGVAPLHLAAMNDLSDAVNLLIDQGADVNIRDHEGHRPLHHAALKGCARVTEVLLARGAQRKVKDKSGQTPLDTAEGVAQAERVDHPMSESEKATWLYNHLEVARILRSDESSRAASGHYGGGMSPHTGKIIGKALGKALRSFFRW